MTADTLPARTVTRPTPLSTSKPASAPATNNNVVRPHPPEVVHRNIDSVNERPAPTPALRIQLSGGNAKSIIDGQRDRLLETPDPAPQVMRAMRDSLLAIYDLSGVGEPDRTRAANLVATLSYTLRDKALCIKWATRATERAPNNEGYSSRLNLCRGLSP